jgi:hypothetical protein
MCEQDLEAAALRHAGLLARFDAAVLALDTWVRRAEVDGPTLEGRRLGAAAESAPPQEVWRERWVVAPLRAAATCEALRQELAGRLAPLQVELETVESEIARPGPHASHEDRARLERRRMDLVEAILAVKARLRTDGDGHASPERLGHFLQRVLHRLACEVFCLVREDLNEAASRARGALTRIEEYEQLVREARSIAGPIAVPSFSKADLEVVRHQASQTVVHFQDLAS